MAEETSAPKLDTDLVVIELAKDHAEHKTGDAVEVSRYIARKLADPARGIAKPGLLHDGPISGYKKPKAGTSAAAA